MNEQYINNSTIDNILTCNKEKINLVTFSCPIKSIKMHLKYVKLAGVILYMMFINAVFFLPVVKKKNFY